MKKIEAIILPYKLDEVHEALNQAGFNSLTVSEIKGYGKKESQHSVYRGNSYNIEFVPKLKLEVVCLDDEAEEAISTIINSARTDSTGDGKIFISHVDEIIRVRTEEIGVSAL